MTTISYPTGGSADTNVMSHLLNAPFLRFVKDQKIGVKLMIGFGVLVVLTFVAAGVSYFGSSQATSRIDRTGIVRVPAALSASQAQADLLRMLSDVRGYLALGDNKYRESYNQYTKAFESDLAQLDLLAPSLDADNQNRLAALKADYAIWKAMPDTLFALRDDQMDREPAYRRLATSGTQYAGDVLIKTTTLIEMQSSGTPDVERLQAMAKFQGTFSSMFSALRGYVTTRNRIFRGEYDVNRTDNQAAWDTLTRKRGNMDSNQQKLLDDIGKSRNAFLDLPDQIFKDLEGPHWREDLYKFSEEAVPQAESMQKLLNDLVVDQQDLLTNDLNDGRMALQWANQLILAGGFVALLFGVLLAFMAREQIAGPISRLTGVAERIRGGDLAAQAAVESKDETGTLAETFNNMTRQLRQTLLQVRKEKKRADGLLEVVIPIGVELASEKNFNLLLEKMLMEAKSFCRADGGTLYLRTDNNQLKYVIVRDDSEQVALGGTTGCAVTYEPLALSTPDGLPNDKLVAARAALQGRSINLTSAQQAQDFDLGDTRIYSSSSVGSLLAIPLKNNKDEVLGVLQLIDAQDADTKKVIPFDQNLQQMMESFSTLAVAALEAYIREQSLQQQIDQLKIEIDEVKRQKQVSEIVDTDFFQSLTEKARAMREHRRKERPASS